MKETKMNLENFEARTAVELALYNEIKKLKLELFLIARERGIFPPDSAKVSAMSLNIHDIDEDRIMLARSAKVRGSINFNGRIEVRAEVDFKENPIKFGQIYFTDSLYENKFEAIHSLSHLHLQFIQSLATALKD